MYCCISGEIPNEPVVTRTSGCLYERRLIEGYIRQHGTCPKTGEPLRVEDLVTVAVGAPTSRRTGLPTTSSIPGLLASLHHEWDALLLEQFSLRQQLAQTQQELSHALYQHDAACRVIAKLMKERDEAKGKRQGAAAGATAAAEDAPGKAASDDDEDDEEEEDGVVLPSIVCDAMDTHEARIKAERKRRQPPAHYIRDEEVVNFVESDALQIFGNSAVTAVQAMEYSGGAKSVLCGSADGKLTRFDVARRQVAGVGVGHTKAVRQVVDMGNTVLSGSDDHSVRVWRAEGDALLHVATMKSHKDAVRGLQALPGDEHMVSGSMDGTLVFADINRALSIATGESSETRTGISSMALHPDGSVVGTASAGRLQLWDLKSMEVHVHVPVAQGCSVSSISFNNDGVTMAAAATSGVVALWDLRKIDKPLPSLTVPILGNGGAVSVAFDRYGSYAAVASEALRVVRTAGGIKELVTLSSHTAQITGLSWGGADGRWLATSSLDKTVRIYSTV